MIISRLYGGLGNQMFQYAFGRSLAIRNNCELKLDISDFRTYKLHPYSLSVFAISGTIATDEECDVLKYRKVSLLESAARKILGKKRKQADSHYIEKSFRFDSEAASLKDGYYLDGYWQSEKYFSDISDIIRKEFTLKNEMNQKNRQVYELIRSCNSVSLHIRRGDYVSDPKAREYHGVDLKKYYDDAVELMKNTVKNPVFFIFSDEPQWVKENFKGEYSFTVVDCNGPDAGHEDMRLMSSCRHHIIANSSFSWWWAWLNPENEKKVIAPKAWFTDRKINTEDLIPERWVRL